MGEMECNHWWKVCLWQKEKSELMLISFSSGYCDQDSKSRHSEIAAGIIDLVRFTFQSFVATHTLGSVIREAWLGIFPTTGRLADCLETALSKELYTYRWVTFFPLHKQVFHTCWPVMMTSGGWHFQPFILLIIFYTICNVYTAIAHQDEMQLHLTTQEKLGDSL